MSIIYLPNGGTIKVKGTWTATHNSNGSISYTNEDAFLGHITASGVVHLSEKCNHTYHPPQHNDLDSCFDAVMNNLHQLSGYKLAKLKKELYRFNAKSHNWK